MTDETTNPVPAQGSQPPSPGASEMTEPSAAPAGAVRSGRARWYVAIGVAGLAVAAIVAVAILAGQGGIAAAAAGYLPATTVAYLDARLDLPGDQRDQVAELLSRFPGFADKAALESKLDETFDRLMSAAVDGGQYSYTGDIKPWFGGQVTVALTSLPDFAASTPSVPALVLMSVKDAAKAQVLLDELIATSEASGTIVQEEAFEGATLWTMEDPSAPSPDMGRAALALTADTIVLGQNADAVRASLTLGAKGGATLAASAAYQEALKALPEARLGTFYLDGLAMRAALAAALLASPTAAPGLDSALAAFPERIVGALHVADGRVIAEIQSTLPASVELPADHTSDLAGRVPATSLAYFEAHSLGEAVGTLVTQLKSAPQLSSMTEQLQVVEGVLGAPLEAYLDWVGDSAIIIGVEGEQPNGALVAQVRDTAVAAQRLGQLGTLIELAALTGSAGIQVATSEHAAVTITEVRLDQAPGVVIAWALKGDTFVIGVGEGSVESVLDVTAATSLGADPRFEAALGAGGATSNSGLVYVDLAGAREAMEALIPERERARYDQEIKPWLEPFDSLIVVAFQEGDDAVARGIVNTR